MKRVLGKTNLGKGICVLCIFSLLLFCLPYRAFAARSRAGGGDLAKFDTGAFITSSAITVGSTLLTAGIGGAWRSASIAAETARFSESAQTFANSVYAAEGASQFIQPVVKSGFLGTTVGQLFSDSSHIAAGFKSLGSINAVLPVMTRGYTTAFAASEIGGAIGAIGAYKGWKPSQVYLASTIASSIVNAGLNPDISLGEGMGADFIDAPLFPQYLPQTVLPAYVGNIPAASALTKSFVSGMGRGAFVGALTGTAKGLTIYAIDRDRIDHGKGPSALGQITGMVTGTMATNFGRALVTTRPAGVQSFQEKDVSNKLRIKGEYSRLSSSEPATVSDGRLVLRGIDNSDEFLRGSSSSTMSEGEIYPEGTTLALRGLEESAGALPLSQPSQSEGNRELIKIASVSHSGQIRLGERISNDEYNVLDQKYALIDHKYNDTYSFYNMRAKVSPFKAATIDTFNDWPTLASKSLSIVATHGLPKNKQYLSPLVGGLTEAITGPVFKNAAEIYGLKPELYAGVGGKEDLYASRLSYTGNIVQMAQDHDASLKNEKTVQEFRTWKKSLNDNQASNEDLNRLSTKLQVPRLNDADKLNAVKDKIIVMEKNPIGQVNKATELDTIQEEYSEGYAMRSLAMRLNSVDSENKITAAISKEGGNLNDALSAANTSRAKLFNARVAGEIRFGVLDSLISETTQAVYNNSMKNASPAQSILVSYGVNMATATLKGIAYRQNKTWDVEDWLNSYDIVKPPETENSGDLVAHSLWKANYDKSAYNYQKALLETGLKPMVTNVGYGDNAKNVELVRLEINKEKPTLSEAIKGSIQQANMGVLKGLALGFPIEKGKDISAYDFVSYTDSVQSMAQRAAIPGQWTRVVADSIVQANLSTASNNIMGIAAQSPALREAFNIAPERIVKTNSPSLPFTIQQMQYLGGIGLKRSGTHSVFPNIYYKVKPNTGATGQYLASDITDNNASIIDKKDIGSVGISNLAR